MVFIGVALLATYLPKTKGLLEGVFDKSDMQFQKE